MVSELENSKKEFRLYTAPPENKAEEDAQQGISLGDLFYFGIFRNIIMLGIWFRTFDFAVGGLSVGWFWNICAGLASAVYVGKVVGDVNRHQCWGAAIELGAKKMKSSLEDRAKKIGSSEGPIPTPRGR